MPHNHDSNILKVHSIGNKFEAIAGAAYEELVNAGAAAVISCNTIVHHSNQIDISDLIAGSLVI